MGKSWKTTITGILMIVGAVSAVLVALVDGDPATNPNWEVAFGAIAGGVGLIFAKDFNVSNSQSPGPTQTVTAAQAAPKGFARLGLLLALSLAGCATAGAGFLGMSGTLGPIAVSADGKSSVTVSAKPVGGTPPACFKPIAVEFQAPNWGTSCSADIPVPANPATGVCQ